MSLCANAQMVAWMRQCSFYAGLLTLTLWYLHVVWASCVTLSDVRDRCQVSGKLWVAIPAIEVINKSQRWGEHTGMCPVKLRQNLGWVRNVVTIATCHVHVMNWAAVADHSSWCVTCYRTAWWGSQGSLGRRSLENRPRARLTPRWGLSITIQKLHAGRLVLWHYIVFSVKLSKNSVVMG